MESKRVKVLLIEDNPGDARLIQEMLKETGNMQFELVHVERLSEGLKHLSNNAYDILLLDLGLPDSQGLDTLNEVYLKKPDEPIVVLTGLTDEMVGVQAVQNGAQDYLIKGQVDNKLLMRSINYAIERKRAQETLRKVNRVLKTLSECNEVLVRAVDELELLRKICQVIVEIGGYHFVWVGFAEYEGEKTVQMTAYAGYKDGNLDMEKPTWVESESFYSLASEVIQTGESYICEDIINNPKYISLRNDAIKHNYESFIILPLLSDGKTFGALSIYAIEADRFDTEEVKLLRELTNNLAFGITTIRTRAKHKKAEEEKEKMRSQLLQAQKMEAIGRLAGGIAHDFNNFLTVIIGYTELLLSDSHPDDPRRSDIQDILNAGEAASLITHQLLAFSRRQAIQPHELNINTIVTDTEKMLRHLISEDIKLITHLEKKPVFVKSDSGQMKQVLINLAVNARDAMPDGGNLTIKTEYVTLNKEACSNNPESRPGKFVRLSVLDTGVGMDKETINNIFDPFFTKKESGTGLGLSVVYSIVKQHEGWIEVQSSPGKGSTFKVYLPAFAVTGEYRAKDTITVEELQGGGEGILLVEDNENVREFCSKVLRKNGYEVYKAEDFKSALDVFEEKKDRIHLVFSDVVLPDGNGVLLVEHLLPHKKELGVILSSGYIDEKSKTPLIQLRGFRFIQKPYHVDELLKVIKEVIGQSE